MSQALCHPHRPLNSHGLCKKCYDRKRYLANSDRTKARSRESHAQNKSVRNEQRWAARLARVYGITPAVYYEILEAQGGVCAICLAHCSAGKRLCVDHEHGTGRIRGLLCTRCNRSIGLFGEDALILASAARYVEGRNA